MQSLGGEVEDGGGAGRGPAAGVLDHEGQRCGLVHEPQFALRTIGILRVFRVQEDPAVEQIAVHVGHQAADVAAGVRPAFARSLEPFDVPAGGFVPPGRIALVDTEDPPPLGDGEIGVAEQELSDAGIEGESVRAAVAGGVDQHGG